MPTEAFQEAPMSRHRRLKIDGGAFFFTLAFVDRGSDMSVGHERVGTALRAFAGPTLAALL